MNTTYLDHIQKLHSLFDTNFMEAYREANPRKRRGALSFIQAIYRRWYYSTMIENTPLSPANILESICRYYNQHPSAYPVAHRRGKTKFTGIDMRLLEYSLDNHPIIDDLRLLINHSTPHVDLMMEADAFSGGQAMEMGAMLSLNDPHYAAYLLEISLWLKLLVKIPSVGVNRFKPANNAADILSAPCKDIFREIVEITITIAAKGLQNLVMLPETLFSPSFIRSILITPMETDDIFGRIYEALGYDFDDILDLTMDLDVDDDSDNMDVDLLAGTFMTGVFLDKFFFTPFGHYMKLIRPLYVLPFEFEGEIADYVQVSDDPEESIIAFFAPCSSYTLTDLGLEFFNVEKTEENYIDAAAVIPFDQMKDTVFSSNEALSVFVEIAKHLGPMRMDAPAEDIYTFRVRLESDPSIWAHIQMPAAETLHDMYIEIADCFDLKENNDYTFYHDKTENRFAEYVSSKRMKRGKKTADTELEDLDFEHQKQMLLVAYNQAVPFGDTDPHVRLQLEMMHTKPPEAEYEYPRVSRVSKGLKDRMME